jgi:hypothetical protein
VRAARGFDSIVYRGGTTGIRLAQADGRADEVPPGAVPVTSEHQLPPLIDVPEALDRIRLAGLPFLSTWAGTAVGAACSTCATTATTA